MKGFSAIAALAAASSALAAPHVETRQTASTTKIEAVTVKGNAFWKGNQRFYMRGIDYQPGGSSKLEDPIATEADCTRDIDNFKKLGINTVRIYSVDNSQPHDVCMKLLADAGIYLVLDLNTPKYSLNRADPDNSYNAEYLQNIFATIDSFHSYNNTLAFFSGNEVIDTAENSWVAPWIKAITRDIRTYIAARGYRAIPVGYSAADVQANRLETALYMNCGTDDERSDFFAFNDYSWCAPSTFTTSGWDQKVKNFTGYGLPLFLSEYGCNTNTRDWGEVAALYSTQMTGVYSGGLAYEYTMEENKYGIVQIDGSTATPLADFGRLQKAFAATPNPSGDGGYDPSHKASQCPPQSTNWNVTGTQLPAMPEEAKKYLTQGAGKGIGLLGSGSHFGKGKSTGLAQQGSGTVSGTGLAATPVATGGSSTSSSAATGLRQGPVNFAPLAISALVVGFTALGAFMV